MDPQRQTDRYFDTIEHLTKLRIDDNDFIDHLVTALENDAHQILIDDIDASIDSKLHNLLNGSLISKIFFGANFFTLSFFFFFIDSIYFFVVENYLNFILILFQNIADKDDQSYVNIGNHCIRFNENVHLYFRTRNPMPTFEPPIYSMMSIIDFNTSEMTMEIELEYRAFVILNSNLEQQYRSFYIQYQNCTNEMKKIDENLLMKIASTNIVINDNVKYISLIQNAKENQLKINNVKIDVKNNLENINGHRKKYNKLSKIATKIYVAIKNMSHIDPMYQFMLDDFIDCFEKTIKTIFEMTEIGIDPADDKVRMESFSKNFSNRIYNILSYGLYECDRLLFAMNITFYHEQSFDRLHQDEIDFFAMMTTTMTTTLSEKSPLLWLSEEHWNNLMAFKEYISYGKYIVQQFIENEAKWKIWYLSDNPEIIDLPVNLMDICQSKFMVNFNFILFICSFYSFHFNSI